MSKAVTLPVSQACGDLRPPGRGSGWHGRWSGCGGVTGGVREGKTFVEVDGTDFI